ncbi:oligogalacturonate-specific porin KdgM family protein [Vibrio sp. B1Z05]|uniref:oligogalacturonate-specific porin KdgM family protein n=1 Tax=Vibrio sp. B1Z05 TaxID=2654980 RepID=UPI00128C2233|nr:oligogalacturonate-specific porin KdgM family protein [Vibrio sp. B1Z05]MPW36389.1 porin [Vibrio sp. B1Z05]
MIKKHQITLFITATVVAASVNAASVDYRQEYKHNDKAYASRVKVGSSVGNHFFSLEAKQTGKPISDWQAADNEFVYGYNFKVNKKWRITPSMPITFGNDRVTYKPQVRVQYKFDSGLTSKLRYRHEFRDYTGDKSDKDSIDRSKITGNLDYKIGALQLGFEANYAQDFFHDNEWFGGKSAKRHNEWDYNVKIGYKEASWSWRPYIELGNVQYSSGPSATNSNRQLRTRVGLTYSF